MLTVRCPACLAAYQVEAEKLGAGRKLKCAKCGTVWLAVPETEAPRPVEDATPAEAPAPAPEAAPAVESQPAPVSSTLAAGLTEEQASFAPGDEEFINPPSLDSVVDARPAGLRVWWQRHQWMVGAVVLATAGLVMGAVVLMQHMDAGSDEAARAGAAPPLVAAKRGVKRIEPPKGIVLRRVRSEISPTDTGVIVTVRGLVTNTTSATLVVPPLLLQLLGKDGNVQDMWPVSSVAGELAAQDENAWTVSLTEPTLESVRGWRVIFTEPQKDEMVKISVTVPAPVAASPTHP